MSLDTTLEGLVRRGRLITVAALAAVVALSWTYLLSGAGMGMLPQVMTPGPWPAGARSDGSMAAMALMTPVVWTPRYAVLMFLMWCVMMVAMMLPSAAPMILLVASINRRQRELGHPAAATSVFAAGYLLIWAGFSLVAVTLQWGLQRGGLLSPTLAGTSPAFGALVLFAAGTYQLTPFKHACLRACRSPLSFAGAHWRTGILGALRLGLLHGVFCVGCCWFLMALLFVGGVMNLFWIAGLALLVLIEKTLPAGHQVGYAIGAVLLAAGTLALIRGF